MIGEGEAEDRDPDPESTDLNDILISEGENFDAEKPETREVLNSLFLEKTGRHMLDSGGAYGRNFEENQAAGLDSEGKLDKPRLTVDLSERSGDDDSEGRIEIIPSVSTYHVLLDALSYSDEAHMLQQLFEEWKDRSGENQLAAMDRFVGEALGAGENLFTVNTFNMEFYNGDQTLQFTTFELNSGSVIDPKCPENSRIRGAASTPYSRFVMVQVHGGCDVRGGYTEPVIFESETVSPYALSHIGDSMYFNCPECGHCGEFVEHELYSHEISELRENFGVQIVRDPERDPMKLVHDCRRNLEIQCGGAGAKAHF